MDKIIITTPEELRVILNTSVNPQFDELRELINKKLNPPKQKLTVKEAALRINVTDLTVRNYIKKGFIQADKIGRRILIDAAELDNALAEVKSLKYQRR